MIHKLLCLIGLHGWQSFRAASDFKGMFADLWMPARECPHCKRTEVLRHGAWLLAGPSGYVRIPRRWTKPPTNPAAPGPQGIQPESPIATTRVPEGSFGVQTTPADNKSQ